MQHRGHLGIAELLDAHQQQRLALLGAEPPQRGQQVQAQADVGAGVAAQAVLRLLQRVGVGHGEAAVAAVRVAVGVVRDGQQPHQHVAVGFELLPVAQRAFHRGLCQVVGQGRVEHQRMRVAAQARQRCEQLVAEGGGGVHAGVYAGPARVIPA